MVIPQLAMVAPRSCVRFYVSEENAQTKVWNIAIYSLSPLITMMHFIPNLRFNSCAWYSIIYEETILSQTWLLLKQTYGVKWSRVTHDEEYVKPRLVSKEIPAPLTWVMLFFVTFDLQEALDKTLYYGEIQLCPFPSVWSTTLLNYKRREFSAMLTRGV